MTELGKTLRGARRSQKAGGAAPIITTPDEARRVAREVADQLGGLPEHERIALLSDLNHLQDALQQRIAYLDQETVAVAGRIRQAQLGRVARLAYSRLESTPSAPSKRRPCP